VAHKANLTEALSRALADRVTLCDMTVGRKGLLAYVKSVNGNVVKVVPDNGRLKVVAGNLTSWIGDSDWIGEKTPMSLCELRVMPHHSVKPNMGSLELAEAISKVYPFAATDDNRPVLRCIYFVAGEGKLELVTADGFRLAHIALDYEGEGQALIEHDDLRGMSRALARAKRVSLGFEKEGMGNLDKLIISTELTEYRFQSLNGNFPDWQKLIPTEFKSTASFDTVEVLRAISSLKALADSKSYPIDLTIGEGTIRLTSPDNKGEVIISADTEGEPTEIRIDGGYLASVVKACGGMVELKVTNGYSPMLFSQNGYQVVCMPMLTDKANQQAKAEREAKQAETKEPEVAEPEAEVEAEPKKAKRSRAKEPVTV